MKAHSPEFACYQWWYVTGPTEEGYCGKIVFLHLAAIDTVNEDESGSSTIII
jgi:hypothetical protein